MDTVIECTPRKIVLRRTLDDKMAHTLVEAKKTAMFRTLLSSPKKIDIHTHSMRVIYEVTTMLSGSYSARYYRKAEHTIRVDYNVKRVEIGDGIFNIVSRSRLARAVASSKSKRRVNLNLEEYVVDEHDGMILIDHHGHELGRFTHSLKSTALESYPTRILESAEAIRESELKQTVLIKRLCERLVSIPEQGGLRNLKDRATIKKITHIYVPIIEAKLVGPKKRIRMLRIDAVNKKVLKA